MAPPVPVVMPYPSRLFTVSACPEKLGVNVPKTTVWLSPLPSSALPANSVAGGTFSSWVAYELPGGWNANRVDWIAVAYDAVTYEVLQAVAVPAL